MSKKILILNLDNYRILRLPTSYFDIIYCSLNFSIKTFSNFLIIGLLFSYKIILKIILGNEKHFKSKFIIVLFKINSCIITPTNNIY